jgi:hypothetical protein
MRIRSFLHGAFSSLWEDPKKALTHDYIDPTLTFNNSYYWRESPVPLLLRFPSFRGFFAEVSRTPICCAGLQTPSKMKMLTIDQKKIFGKVVTIVSGNVDRGVCEQLLPCSPATLGRLNETSFETSTEYRITRGFNERSVKG